MIRTYCDLCDREIKRAEPNRVSERLRRTISPVHIEVTVGTCAHGSYVPTWNSGHVCTECVLRVVAEGHAA